MSPIEQAARELVRQDYYGHGHQPCREVEGYVDQEWLAKADEVRTVISALREPSEAMLRAVGVNAAVAPLVENYWKTMIDALLEEG